MTFNEYLLHIAGAAFCGIIGDIINEGFLKKNRSVDKYIKFGITLCIAASVMLPLMPALGGNKQDFSGMGKLPENTTEFSEQEGRFYILETECEEKVSEAIKAQTGIVPLEVCIKIKLDNDVPVIKTSKITVEKNDSDETEKIKEIAEKLLGTETEVVTKE